MIPPCFAPRGTWNLQAGKALSFSAVATNRTFHRAADSILCSRVKPHKSILLKLLYSNCVPVITYACAVRDFSSSEMLKCHVAISNSIRRIFSLATWQSIRHIRIENGYQSIYEIFSIAKTKFLRAATDSSNSIVLHLASILT